MTTRDRNQNYVPDGLYLTGQRQLAEISRRRTVDPDALLGLLEVAELIIVQVQPLAEATDNHKWVAAANQWTSARHDLLEQIARYQPRTGRITHGQADELNRDDHGSWSWADVSGDGTHWSHFRGHRIQVDLTFSTWNEREVNDWKGRDEIRPCGEWHLALNRQPIWEGNLGTDPLAALARVEHIARQLMDHPALHWFDTKPITEQLAGRRVYFDRTPAVVSYVSTLHQGYVGLKPVGVDVFPPSLYDVDRGEPDLDPYERNEIKVDLLDAKVHWWRDKLVAGVEDVTEAKESAA